MLSCFDAITDNKFSIEFNKLSKMFVCDAVSPFEKLIERAPARITSCSASKSSKIKDITNHLLEKYMLNHGKTFS